MPRQLWNVRRIRRAAIDGKIYAQRASRDAFFNGLLMSSLVPRSWRRAVLRVAGLDLGACAISSGCYFGGTSISIGDGTFINVGVMLDASAPIRIGRKCIVAMRVLICTSSHETGTPDHFVDRPTRAGVTIGDGCWLGAGSLVMPGVTIGANCVVAAGAVVVKDCAPNGLYGGVPAKRIREI